jgi:Mg2+-importing ATPase
MGSSVVSAIQDMGAMDVLCTDKTGTLTEACIHLERHVDASGKDDLQVAKRWFYRGVKNNI